MSRDPVRFDMGGVACTTHTIPQFLSEIRDLVLDTTKRPRVILWINAHVYNLTRGNPDLRRILNAARVVVADGMVIVWAARLFGVRMTERCNMTEAFRAYLEAPGMPPTRAILIGCQPAEAEAAAAEINRVSSHCRVLHAWSGFLSDAEYRRRCAELQPMDFILLGMGTPRSEVVAEQLAEVCPATTVWGIGGGTIRIFAGTMREAPVIWRRLGLQWLHRLVTEPRPLWRRYLLGNPLFLLNVTKAAWARRRAA